MNAKHAKFVAEYLVDQNGTRAAQRAGYKGNDNSLAVRAHSLLRIVKVKEAIDAGLKKQNDEVLARVEKKVQSVVKTKAEWLERITAIGFADMGDAFQPDANGKLTMKIEDMKKSGFSKLIRKMRVLPGGKVEVDLHSVLPALELLGKAEGWVKDQVEHSGSIAQPTTLDAEERKKIFSSPEALSLARQLAKSLKTPGNETPGKGDQ